MRPIYKTKNSCELQHVIQLYILIIQTYIIVLLFFFMFLPHKLEYEYVLHKMLSSFSK
jgi:hypothetical protein